MNYGFFKNGIKCLQILSIVGNYNVKTLFRMTLSCQGRWSPLKNSCTKKLVYGLANFSRQLSFMLSEIQHGFKQFCEICFLDFKESLTLTAQNYEWYGFWMAIVTTFIMLKATFKPKILSYLTFKVYVLSLSGLPKRFKA